jgi:UDP-N-acetylmuramate dehydrogenase
MPLVIQENVNLQKLNSFQLKEYCRYFCRITSESELTEALHFASSRKLETLILGGGSNILLSKSFPGLVIKLDNLGIQEIHRDDESVGVRVAAGENWHFFVMHCLSKGWFGLENLSLIPGSVGAAPMQNIGAYGVEVANRITQIRYFDTFIKEWKSLHAADCHFGYRDSIFKNELKGRAIIWEVDFRLSTTAEVVTGYGDVAAVLASNGIEKPKPADVSRAVIKIRQSKLPDPAVTGNAGSFFKNPVISLEHLERLKNIWPLVPSYPTGEGMVKVPAGWLIEQAGWKGKRQGNCGVHDRQALVLVNLGGATGREILELSQLIRSDVERKTGILLQPEVNLY